MLGALRGFIDSMAGRIFSVLVLGIAAAALAASLLAGLQRSADVTAERADRVVDRIVTALATDPPPPGTHRIGHFPAGQSVPALQVRIAQRLPQWRKITVSTVDAATCAAAPPPPPMPDPDARPATNAPPVPPPPPPVADPGAPRSLCYAVRLSDGSGRTIMLAVDAPPGAKAVEPVASTSFLVALALAVLALALIVARMAARPIARLAIAARSLGDDLDRPPIAKQGPSDVRDAIAAFNDMQARLRQTVEERTFMLAAISHDLRTPLTRLRLRMDAIPDTALRERLIADTAAMAALIEEGLELARLARGSGGAVMAVDVGALVFTVCEDAQEAGHEVSCTAASKLVIPTQMDALRRILNNLLDNALLHGGSACVKVSAIPGAVRICIADRGPGIPEAELDRVFEPFRQLDTARSHDRGSGLGLTITRILARHIGAEVVLANRAGGGVEAIVNLPYRQAL
ncbi:ATP-binding protein [Novosphingobium sp. Leaf2]|uniref:ATP-binding protein n=1 Tax=Novosphingobium sp. Leaf2 TaxID=1735670 RepID=UPI000715641D|nr:ATP-binding protein [Novosphingobium sp. Leaf2]KQM18340.1 hypothetical protein ASE49_08980 [Novosphingobium sp. Leaf2]